MIRADGRVVRLDEWQLRAAAAVLRRFTGLRLGRLTGSYPASSPATGGRCGKQFAVVQRLSARLRARLPADHAVVEGVLLEGRPPERPAGSGRVADGADSAGPGRTTGARDGGRAIRTEAKSGD